MNTAKSCLRDLRSAGIELAADGGTLIARPAVLLTDDLRDLIRANKPELLALVAANDTAREAKRATDPFRVGESAPGERVLPPADARCPQWQAFVERGWSPQERRERLALAPKAFRKRILSHVRTAYAIRRKARKPEKRVWET